MPARGHCDRYEHVQPIWINNLRSRALGKPFAVSPKKPLPHQSDSSFLEVNDV